MALIKKGELKQMNEKTLRDKLNELKKELIKLNTQRAIGSSLESPGRIKQIRKMIARILTLLNKKGREVNKKHE